MTAMNRVIAAAIGALLGLIAGAVVGTGIGMLLVAIFPPDKVAGGPEAGFGTVMGSSLAGQVLGIFAGAVTGWRYGMTGAKKRS